MMNIESALLSIAKAIRSKEKDVSAQMLTYSANQSIANAAWVRLTNWTLADATSGENFIEDKGSGVIEFKTNGLYLINVYVTFDNNGSGSLRGIRYLHGSGGSFSAAAQGDMSDYRYPVSFHNKCHLTDIREHTEGEQICVDAYQNRGASLNVTSGAGYNLGTKIEIIKLA